MQQKLLRFVRSFSGLGVLLATLFFAASLAPSLIPRHFATQGVLSGLAVSAGYFIGVVLRWLWQFFELPEEQWTTRPALRLKAGASVVCAGVAAYFLWHASEWQNSIRALMEMPPTETAEPFAVGLIAFGVFLVFLLIARAFKWAFRLVDRRLENHVPRRVSFLLALVLASALFWTIGNGVLVRGIVGLLDSSYARLDALIEDGMDPPADTLKTGGPGSLLEWEPLGRQGRLTIAALPGKAEIEAFTGQPAMEPIRVYVGARSAETVAERANLALRELIRVGGFDRSILVIATPTGTGWVDPAGQQPLEYLHHGDVATVAVQYSYLPSWLSILVDPDIGAETARAVFAAIYGHWTALPPDNRPKLYLNGLSLGSLNSNLSFNTFQVLSDPFDGIFWIGPPFQNDTWAELTQQRDAGSPPWLPRIGNGSVVRFTSQTNHLGEATAPWGRMRFVILQYASDPMTFSSPAYAFMRPEWLNDPRGPDVSPLFEWYPVVTFFQLLVDMMTAVAPPMGYGHVYAPEHYIDGWVEVTQPTGWTPADIDRLKEKLARELRGQEANP